MHPAAINNLRDAIVTDLPESDTDLSDAQRLQVEPLLKMYGVSSVKDARALPPRELILRMFKQSGDPATMEAMKKAKTVVKDISIKRTTKGALADAWIVSRLGEKEFSGMTHFLLERVKDDYLVVYMSKTRNEE